jgi:hypothetical protein
MLLEKRDNAIALLVEMFGTLPGVHLFHVWQELRQFRADYGGVRRVIARKNKAGHRASSRELARDAEDKVA